MNTKSNDDKAEAFFDAILLQKVKEMNSFIQSGGCREAFIERFKTSEGLTNKIYDAFYQSNENPEERNLR